MHPNTFLRTFWRAEIRPEVFVAMSFDAVYQPRFKEIIEPAITSITHRGQQLSAKRVDLSKSGDSILTDINDGVAHSLMVLADVSINGHDSKTTRPYRNGNVMYEVGLALASRHPSEVLLIRDDKVEFLFDVSTIPHMHMNFADVTGARRSLAEELVARLREIDHINDARLTMATATMSSNERKILRDVSKFRVGELFHFETESLFTETAVPRLLDKQLIRTVNITESGKGVFQLTLLGKALADKLAADIPIQLPKPNAPASSADLIGDGASPLSSEANTKDG